MKPQIVIKKMRVIGETWYEMQLQAGSQSFAMKYESTDYADMEWYASMLAKFFANIGVPEVEIIRERSHVEAG